MRGFEWGLAVTQAESAPAMLAARPQWHVKPW